MENTGSKYYKASDAVSVVRLEEYNYDSAVRALTDALMPIGGLDFVKPGMKVVIKANLVSAMKPSQAATTHPVLLCALVTLLREKGAEVVIGDSPGGLYNSAFLSRIYNVTGMHETEKFGAELNRDFSQKEAVFPEGKVLKSFLYTGYLDKADVIINFCKLKSHGMMGMSCGAKNMFGTVPGVTKPEYHFRFPDYDDFADMITDLGEYFHPVLTIADAVVGMEGNGPTAGTPRKIGCILASKSPHTLDYVAADMLGFSKEELPILMSAYRRGLIPENVSEIKVYGSLEGLKTEDFERVVERSSLLFSGKGKSRLRNALSSVLKLILRTRPEPKKDKCVGCGICVGICPAKAIRKVKGKIKIDRKKCIRCFCCQEFCPKSAIVVHRTAVARIFGSGSKNEKAK